MRKVEYFAAPAVNAVVAYLRPLLNGNNLHHSYFDKRAKREWSCQSLFDAVDSYTWKRKNFYETADELRRLRNDIRRAVRPQDNASTVEAAKAIQNWGGTGGAKVPGKKKKTSNNIAIDMYGGRFAEYLKLCSEAIGGSDQISTIFAEKQMCFRSNAGFTKIYALLLDEYCIYDSRVAAALCLLIRRCCCANGFGAVPEPISFLLMAERGSGRRRNPSQSPFEFHKTHQSNALHFKSNMRANWLLDKAISGTPFEKRYGSNALRALEAALFMIGYDVNSEV